MSTDEHVGRPTFTSYICQVPQNQDFRATSGAAHYRRVRREVGRLAFSMTASSTRMGDAVAVLESVPGCPAPGAAACRDRDAHARIGCVLRTRRWRGRSLGWSRPTDSQQSVAAGRFDFKRDSRRHRYSPSCDRPLSATRGAMRGSRPGTTIRAGWTLRWAEIEIDEECRSPRSRERRRPSCAAGNGSPHAAGCARPGFEGCRTSLDRLERNHLFLRARSRTT